VGTTEEAGLRWRELSSDARAALERKLEGLYGHERDESAFDSLAVDKQQALLILMRRLRELKLWDTVRRVENVYGEGGTGMNFIAWPLLESTLRRRNDFTAWFATHGDTNGGFIERGRTRAALHILYVEGEQQRRWAAHFDLYNPWTSPLNAWRHLLHEKLRRETPGWLVIRSALWNSERKTVGPVSDRKF
jgi:hypothetical protein